MTVRDRPAHCVLQGLHGVAFVERAAQLGAAIHKVEEGIWDGLLQMMLIQVLIAA